MKNVTGLLALLGLTLTLAGAEPLTVPVDNQTGNDVPVVFTGPGTQTGAAITVDRHRSSLIVGDQTTDALRVRIDLHLTPAHHLRLMLGSESGKPQEKAASMMTIHRDGKGFRLLTRPYDWDEAAAKWVPDRQGAGNLVYWPVDRRSKEPVEIEGIEGPRHFSGRTLSLEVAAGEGQYRVSIGGYLVHAMEVPAGAVGSLALELMKGDRIEQVTLLPSTASERYLPVNLDHLDMSVRAEPAPQADLSSAGVPFELARDGQAELDLSRAHWREVAQDPASYYENYDAGAEFLGDPRQPMVRVPVADYIVAHLLAVADPAPGTAPLVTLRAGRFGYAGQTVQHEFASEVPPTGTPRQPAQEVQLGGQTVYHVRIPLDLAFAQDLSDRLDIELTKAVRLARRRPDPARFRYRPVGLPSGVRILALTLEKSPLQMRVFSDQSAHAFEQPAAPVFKVELRNITTVPQGYRLAAAATHLYGKRTSAEASGVVPAGQQAVVELTIPYEMLGYHAITLSLSDGEGRFLMNRETSFAMLPPDTRQHRDRSPMGTWDFFGGHFTPDSADVLGPLYRKAGLRYGMFGATPEERLAWGVKQGSAPKVSGSTVEKVQAWFDKNPNADRVGLLLHEDAVSGSHISRVPDAFHNRAPYRMDEKEQERFQSLWDAMATSAKALRDANFDIHLRLGNGGLPQKEEFYRHKFPKELFDSIGNEAGVFGRPPEAQPPDWVANNASLWMDRVMADHYGYDDMPVTQCYEITYPSTNPGNLSLRTQADYFVRHAIHSMVWEIPTIRVGIITDVGNSYYFGNWGAAGLCFAKPEMSVKPSFVSMATMTRVLDGATFARVLDLGSTSLYGVQFDRYDGKRVYVLWNLQGARPITFAVEGQAEIQVVDSQGNLTPWQPQAGAGLDLTASPTYLVTSAELSDFTPGPPWHDDVPSGEATVIASLASLDGWTVEPKADPVLDYHNFMAPRRWADFSFEPVAEFEGKAAVLQVTPHPPPNDNPILAMPMYSVLRHDDGIPMPGRPTAVGIWVNGNSSQGRIIFDFTDAKGERWTSIGAPQAGEPTRWMLDWMPEEAVKSQRKVTMADWNTNDVFGISRIDFDGWRYLEYPLPGNYPGEQYPWPASSQWRYDQDGIVDYPLTCQAVIVELPEKTLHMKTYAPVSRPAVYLKDLTVVEGDPVDHHPRGFVGRQPND